MISVLEKLVRYPGKVILDIYIEKSHFTGRRKILQNPDHTLIIAKPKSYSGKKKCRL